MRNLIEFIVFVGIYTLMGYLLEFVFVVIDPTVYAFCYCLFGTLFGELLMAIDKEDK